MAEQVNPIYRTMTRVTEQAIKVSALVNAFTLAGDNMILSNTVTETVWAIRYNCMDKQIDNDMLTDRSRSVCSRDQHGKKET